jgi:predicted SAM-dependent methyltransferase
MLSLNVGCGSNKISGCVNIDAEASCKPDVVADITKQPLPYESGTVDTVYFFHCIEHIPAAKHLQVLGEFWRVLKTEGRLVMAYPEFSKCAQNWLTNHKGQKAFWRATLYGRQLYPSDFHVALMDSEELEEILLQVGFRDVEMKPEPTEVYNTVCKCVKGEPMITYEQVLKREIFGA